MKKTSYSKDYFPVAPTLPIGIASPGEAPIQGEAALIDTGADGTFVPSAILEELDLPVSYMVSVRAHAGDSSYRAPVYKVDIVLFDSIRLPGIDVVGDDWGDRIILGRNVLNLLKLRLDGPGQSVELQE